MLEKSDLTLANWDEIRLEILRLMEKRGIKSIPLVPADPKACRASENSYKYYQKQGGKKQ